MELTAIYERFLKSTGICTDSRKLKEGQMFVALKGPSFNGNRFAEQVLDRRAAYVIVDEGVPNESDPRVIKVEDGLLTLQALAAFHRQQFSIPTLGITGSNGKTTNKELIYAILSSKYMTHCTKGNLNNHIGVPLTLLELTRDHEFAIVEMGANHVGEINDLCLIGRPEYGLITSIGLAHLEGFGSFEGIKKGKGELYQYVAKHKGSCFVHRGLEFIDEIFQKNGGTEAIYYGGDTDQIRILSVVEHPQVSVTVKLNEDSLEINSQLLGRFQADNILHAVAVGHHFRIQPDQIKRAIELYKAENNRAQLIEDNGNRINLDAYNANPSSMSIALKALIEQASELPKMAILGDMFELGSESKKYHQEIIDQANVTALHEVILVGKAFAGTSIPERFHHFDDVQQAKQWWDVQNITGYNILIKGSRGVALEQILEN